MPPVDHRSYHERRAREELQRAAEAQDPAVAVAHRELAALHRRRLIQIVDEGMALQAAVQPAAVGQPA